MKMKMITKAIALTLCASMIMGTPTENFAKAQGSAAETKQDEKKDSAEVTWNLKAIEADSTDKTDGNLAGQGNKIRIAILDSGVDYSESVNVVERKDFLGENISPIFEDGTGHGTAVASVIGSSGENGSIKGINPNIEIYSAKILDNNNKASIDRVVKAIDWAIEKKVNIINMSFGRKGNSVTLHNAIRRAKRAGILMFASSGNGGSSEENNVEYPAAYDEVVAVGAVTPEGTLSDMTSTGDELELLAPGEYIKTTGWMDLECISNGTSFAVPHVTGIASLLWQKDFSKSADYIRNLLKASAKTVTAEDGKEYSLVDYEYACKIYDDYSEQYIENCDVEELTEEFENEVGVDDYSDEVEGRWSRTKHERTVTYASQNAGGLSSTQIAIVKLGSRAPDDYCNASIYPSHNMLHALSNHNYVKVYEQIMNMSLRCKKYGHKSAMNIGYPDGDPGVNNECETVRRWLGEPEIKVMLNGQYAYTDRNAALIMMGVAMHVVADTYAHKSWEVINGKWCSHGEYPIAGNSGSYKTAYTNKVTGEKYYNRADDTSCCESRWTCARKACAEILAVWNGNCPPSFEEYDIQGYSSMFRLEKLYYFSSISWNGIDFNAYKNRIQRLSFAD